MKVITSPRYVISVIEDLRPIEDCAVQWHVLFNPNKTVCMIISKKVQRPPRVSLYLNGNLIHRVQFCYLGLWLSENISWDKHVGHVLKCSALSIVNLQKMYHFDRRVKLSIYKIYIRALLENATAVFNGNLSKTQVDSLENVLMPNFYMNLGSSHWPFVENTSDYVTCTKIFTTPHLST